MKSLLILSCILGSTALIPPSAFADCSPASGVMMNEVRFFDTDSPFGETRVRAFVELYNKSGSPVDVTGWQITNADGLSSIKATLPSVSIPAQDFLMIWFATGTNELDFSDTVGNVYTNGDSMGVFSYVEDGIGLYDNLGTIIDYVTWSENGAPPAGAALTSAVGAGVWTSGDYIDVPTTVGNSFPPSTWRLLPDGYDFNQAADWHSHSWGDAFRGAFVAGSNRIEQFPGPTAVLEPDSLFTFSWGSRDSSSSLYHLQVGTDSTFTTGNLVDAFSTAKDTALALPAGSYYWRVSLVDTCGEQGRGFVPLEVFANSLFSPLPPGGFGGRAVGTAHTASVPYYFQHKDTNLLCIYDNKPGFWYKNAFGISTWDSGNHRPGCTETADDNGPWDGPHSANHAAHFTKAPSGKIIEHNCAHCGNYCARASVQMINHKFGGNLSQDRISYEFMKHNVTDPSPEGDLGHDKGVPVSSVKSVLPWAVKNVTVTGPFTPTFAGIKQQIDAGFPVFVAMKGHAMVVDDYKLVGAGGATFNQVRVRDPWPGGNWSHGGWHTEGFINSTLIAYWAMTSTGTPTGATQESTITTDSDGDGMMDFDEGAPDYPADRPRQFKSKHTIPDTDFDEVTDKTEVRSYTFYGCGDNDAISFPDIDNDGLRAEGDCDSDHKTLVGCFDGGEDIHNTGICTDRSDPYNASDDHISVTTDKDVYVIGDPVLLSGSYFHANSTYPVDLIPGCPLLIDKQPLGSDVTVSSDNGGVVPFQQITTCSAPGIYLAVADILKNQICEKGPCENPDVCWICMTPTFGGDDDDSTGWEDPTGTNNNPLGAGWMHVPDNQFHFTGTMWAIDSFQQPTEPVDAALRSVQFQVQTQGELVFLSYQHAYFGMGGLQGTVRMSQDGGFNWDILQQFTPGNDVQGWEAIELTPYLSAPLPAPGITGTAVGPMVIIEFLAQGPPSSGAWFVDDITVGEVPAAQVGVPEGDDPPTKAFLAPNYPNPFKAQTTIRFSLPANAGKVILDILDINGRRIQRLVNGELPAGGNSVTWDGHDALGRDVATGVYFYRLKTSESTLTKKMTFIK